MKKTSTIKREIRRLTRINRNSMSTGARDEAFEVARALEWVLDERSDRPSAMIRSWHKSRLVV